MRIFLDANVIVSVINKEYPLYTFSSKILSLAGYKNFELYTSPLCLAISFYFAEKKFGALEAKRRIKILMDHIKISFCGIEESNKAIENKKATDFEDALQYYSALSSKCKYIVTNDVDDYYFSSIEVLKPEIFLNKFFG
ncbi:MAG: PIN domain-containing protein [Bacteroidota bacterium]